MWVPICGISGYCSKSWSGNLTVSVQYGNEAISLVAKEFGPGRCQRFIQRVETFTKWLKT